MQKVFILCLISLGMAACATPKIYTPQIIPVIESPSLGMEKATNE